MSTSPANARTARSTTPTRTATRSREVLEREKVLDAALLLLLEHGPSRMRLAELARQLGVVPSALHYHFAGGKDEVIAVLFDREEARVLESMTTAIARAEGPRGQLLALATARLKNASRLTRLHRAEEAREAPATRERPAAAELQDYVMQRRQHFMDREREMISQILRSGARKGLGHRTVELLAAAFQGALFNVTRTFALTTNREAERVLTELVDLFFLGLEPQRRDRGNG